MDPAIQPTTVAGRRFCELAEEPAKVALGLPPDIEG